MNKLGNIEQLKSDLLKRSTALMLVALKKVKCCFYIKIVYTLARFFVWAIFGPVKVQQLLFKGKRKSFGWTLL